jgi:hypothetical protein
MFFQDNIRGFASYHCTQARGLFIALGQQKVRGVLKLGQSPVLPPLWVQSMGEATKCAAFQSQHFAAEAAHFAEKSGIGMIDAIKQLV